MSEHIGLPVHGYKSQSNAKVELVNQFKILEEQILRALDVLKEQEVDQRWLAIGRTDLEKAFMAINRSIFQPSRFNVPKDDANGQG